jgi:hypothetical protein
LIAVPRSKGDETYNALAFPMLGLPGVLFHPKGRAIGVPIKGFDGSFSIVAPIYLAIEVESGLDRHGRPIPGGPPFDFKLYQAFRPTQGPLWLDAMAHEGAGVGLGTGSKPLKVEFRNHSTYSSRTGLTKGTPKRVLGGQLDVSREIKINDKMMPFMPNDVCFYVYPGDWDLARRLSVDTLVRAHKWSGMMSWTQCRYGCQDSKRQWAGPLHDVWVDDHTEEIYIPIPGHDAYLVVDFDDSNVDMKVVVPVRQDSDPLPPFAFQWTLPGSGCKIKGKVYDTPRQVALMHLTRSSSGDGRYSASVGEDPLHLKIKMMIQLDDVPFDTLFSHMILDSIPLNFEGGRRVSAGDVFPHLSSIIQQTQANLRRIEKGEPEANLIPVPPLPDLPAWRPGFDLAKSSDPGVDTENDAHDPHSGAHDPHSGAHDPHSGAHDPHSGAHDPHSGAHESKTEECRCPPPTAPPMNALSL